MKRNALLKLKSYMAEYQEEYGPFNQMTIPDLIDDIDSRLPVVQKKNKKIDLDGILDLIDEGKHSEISLLHPKLDVSGLVKLASSSSSADLLNGLEDMTLVQLKIVHYLLVKDRQNAAIKTSKKKSTLASVKDAIYSKERWKKLGL